MSEFEEQDAKNKRTLADFETDMQRQDSHICEKCGSLLSERLVREIRKRNYSAAAQEQSRTNGRRGGRPRKGGTQ
jgi:hypothetical protein